MHPQCTQLVVAETRRHRRLSSSALNASPFGTPAARWQDNHLSGFALLREHFGLLFCDAFLIAVSHKCLSTVKKSVMFSPQMANTSQNRKIHRDRRFLENGCGFEARVRAPINGEDSEELHRFGLLDLADPFPFRDLEKDIYLRED